MANQPRPSFGDNVKRLRQLRGWTLAELARRAKMDRPHLTRIEDGTYRSPRPENVEKLARAFNVDADELTGKSPMRRITPYESNSEYRELIDALENLTAADREEVIRHAMWASEIASLLHESGRANLPVVSKPRIQIMEEEFVFPISQEDFKELDFDYPQPYHYKARVEPEVLSAAAGMAGRDGNVVRFLNPRGVEARDVIDRISRVIRVVGDSMEIDFKDGDLVRVDTRIRNPRDGEPVAVYCDALGGSILGFIERTADSALLRKMNAAKYPNPVYLPESGWILLGPIVELVHRDIRRGHSV